MDAVPAAVGEVAPAVPPPTIEVVDAPRTERTRVALDELATAASTPPRPATAGPP